jgi:hypothetical protein
MSEFSEGTVQRLTLGTNHIFYHHCDVLNGILIVFMYAKGRIDNGRIWEEFLRKVPGPIYFSVENPSYIGNHCKFHGNYGGKKVYQYVR